MYVNKFCLHQTDSKARSSCSTQRGSGCPIQFPSSAVPGPCHPWPQTGTQNATSCSQLRDGQPPRPCMWLIQEGHTLWTAEFYNGCNCHFFWFKGIFLIVETNRIARRLPKNDKVLSKCFTQVYTELTVCYGNYRSKGGPVNEGEGRKLFILHPQCHPILC